MLSTLPATPEASCPRGGKKRARAGSYAPGLPDVDAAQHAAAAAAAADGGGSALALQAQHICFMISRTASTIGAHMWSEHPGARCCGTA